MSRIYLGAIGCASAEFSPGGSERAVLCAEEIRRAEAIQLPAAQRRFVAGRWLARTMLSRVMNIAAESVPISISPNGRPTLPAGTSWDFNISHSGDIAVCAVADVPVGVDVERVTARRNLLEVARECFQPEEVEDVAVRLDGEGPGKAAERFTAYWALKESHMKRLGHGIWDIKDAPPFLRGRNPETPAQDALAWYCYELSHQDTSLSYVLAVSVGKDEERGNLSWPELHLMFLLAEDPLPRLLFRSASAELPEGRG